ncbi:hypothetical protein ACFTSF_26040 [Kribbella sp. NPDC056951]|uniref:hypothetical protein n=1 Tax=Kribbella sp. NPDC056951 TaxID=3345978 RepID=UPI003627BDDF
MKRRIAIIAAAIGLGLAATTALPANASWHPGTVLYTGAKLRDCYHPTHPSQPGLGCTNYTTMNRGWTVHVVCQHWGDVIAGSEAWYYIVVHNGPQGYVHESQINSGYDGYIPGVDVCNY